MFVSRLIAAVGLTLILACSASAEPLKAATYKVGVSIPLTGPAATYGSDLQKLIPFFAEEIAPGKFSFSFEDDKCNPREAATVAQRFVQQKVDFVIGLPCSGAVIATAPLYAWAKIPSISILAGSPKLSGLTPYLFHTRPIDVGASELLASYLNDKYKLLGLLYEETEYAAGMADALAASLKEPQKLIKESYSSESSDFRGQIRRLKSRQIDALIIFAQSEQGLLLALRQANEVGLKVPLISNWAADSPSFRKAAGADGEGIVFPGLRHPDEITNPRAAELFARFTKQAGELSSIQASFECTYDAISALAAVAGSTDPAVKLHSDPFPGLSGEYRFNEKGDSSAMQFELRKTNSTGSARLN